MKKKPIHLSIHQWLYREPFRMHRSVHYSLVFAFALLSTQFVGGDSLGTYLMYDADQEIDAISEMAEDLSTTMFIAKEDDGSYSVVITPEVSKEQWEKSQALMKETLEGLSPEEKKNIEQSAARMSGAKPSETEGMFDQAAEYAINEVQSYESVKKTG